MVWATASYLIVSETIVTTFMIPNTEYRMQKGHSIIWH